MTHEDAVVLRLWDFSETSQTGALFTRGRGVVRCLAKGSKRPRAKFSGGLELVTRGEAVLIVKPGADMAQLIEWDLGESYFGLRQSIDAHLAGSYVADLVFRCVTDHDPHERLFDAMVETLDGIQRAPRDPAAVLNAVLRFQWATLAETGYTPSLEVDVRTGGPLERRGSYGFDPRLGGLTRDPGGAATGNFRDLRDAHAGEVWRVRAETVDALRTLADGPPPTLEAENHAPTSGPAVPPADLGVATRGVGLLAAWIAHSFGEAPPAQAQFLERVRSNLRHQSLK